MDRCLVSPLKPMVRLFLPAPAAVWPAPSAAAAFPAVRRPSFSAHPGQREAAPSDRSADRSGSTAGAPFPQAPLESLARKIERLLG